MNKKLKTLIAALTFTALLFYIGGTLAGGSFNPFKWDQVIRVFIAVFYVIMSMAVCSLVIAGDEI